MTNVYLSTCVFSRVVLLRFMCVQKQSRITGYHICILTSNSAMVPKFMAPKPTFKLIQQ